MVRRLLCEFNTDIIKFIPVIRRNGDRMTKHAAGESNLQLFFDGFVRDPVAPQEQTSSRNPQNWVIWDSYASFVAIQW